MSRGTQGDRINELLARVDGLEALTASLREQLQRIERFLGSEIAKHVIDQVGADVGHKLRTVILDAIMASGAKLPDEKVTITVLADTLRYSDPRLLECKVVEEYAARAIPRLRLRAITDPANMTMTTYDIRIPEFGVRHAICD